MEVQELNGGLLDYWVALAVDEKGPKILYGVCYVLHTEEQYYRFSPSVNWGHGGPLIDNLQLFSECRKSNGCWAVKTFGKDDNRGMFPAYGYGETLLLAAMRCIVASKFGDIVPDEVPA